MNTLGIVFWIVFIGAVVAWFIEHRVRPSWSIVIGFALIAVLGLAEFGGPLHSLR